MKKTETGPDSKAQPTETSKTTMCFNFGAKRTPTETSEPTKPGAEADVGAARKAEDQELFGGVPDLRVDRSATGKGVQASGSGLKVM